MNRSVLKLSALGSCLILGIIGQPSAAFDLFESRPDMARETPDCHQWKGADCAVIGKNEAARTEITSGLWKYIKANNLQDPKNKRDILTDVKLKAVFGKPKVGMFEMTKLIGKHLK